MAGQHEKYLLARTEFLMKVGKHLNISVAIIAIALCSPALGYRLTEDLSWINCFLPASVILTGMGPVSPFMTFAGKLFATFYTLFNGIIFVSVVTILLVPFLHRLLRYFYLVKDQPFGRADSSDCSSFSYEPPYNG